MTLYTLRLAVDDAVLVSERKRQHKVVVGSRTWSNCRKALAEMAVKLASVSMSQPPVPQAATGMWNLDGKTDADKGRRK